MGRTDVLPLYASAASRPVFTGTGNAGLWYDKFCDRWRADWTLASSDRESPKLSWIALLLALHLTPPWSSAIPDW